MSQSIQGNIFSCLARLSSRGSTHTTVTRGTALWESLVGKPRGKASWKCNVGMPRGKATDPLIHAKGSVTLLLQLGRKGHVHAPIETRTDSPGETQKYPKIHVSTGQETSVSGTDSTQGLRPQHRRDRNPERPPSNSHGAWPFLRSPERVPEVPDVSCEHLSQVE